jgi:hypothetical protein
VKRFFIFQLKYMQGALKKTQKIFGIAGLAVVLFVSFSFKSLASQEAGITKEEVIQMVNDSREEDGLEILTENEKLSQAAQAKAENMLKENYFAHNSPSGKTPWFWIEQSGYDYHYAGENLAMDFKTAGEQHLAWMKSPTHKKNILNKDFREIGVAVREGFIEGHMAIITVQEFGAPMNFISSHPKNKEPLPKVKALEIQADVNSKTVPIIKENQLNDSFFKNKLLLADWRSLIYLYLNTLILLTIGIINPLIIMILIVQFVSFKAEDDKELVLKN